jgi:putative PIN family toxin of toxin-antitoxin system
VTRAVVDTNVWVSALISPRGTPGKILDAYLAGRFVLVVSEPLFEELARVLKRPRLARRHGATPARVDELVAGFRERAEVLQIAGTVQHCRDPKDDMVGETAVLGRVGVLVTGDPDFDGSPIVVAALSEIGTRILTPATFLAELSGS